MKRKYQRKTDKALLTKKNANSKLEDFFKNHSNNPFSQTSTKFDNSPVNNNPNKKFCILRNPSKQKFIEEDKEELKRFHHLANKTILCDFSLIDILYKKLIPSFEKIDIMISKMEKDEYKNINISKKNLIIKFILQLKYIDIIYLSPILLSDSFDEEKISQNIRNFVGFSSHKGITMNFSPNTIKECQEYWPNITDIISKYLKYFHEGKGLYIYVEHDYVSYLDKIKLLCNLNNYETCVIDETNQAKGIILDKLSEAMQTKRLASIPEQLGTQILLLKEMVNSFSFKWKIFTKIQDNIINKNEENYSNKIYLSNNINSISCDFLSENKNDPITLSNRDIYKVFEELSSESRNNSKEDRNKRKHNKKYFNIGNTEEDYSKNEQLSTNETLFTIFNKKCKKYIETNDRNLEQAEFLWQEKELNKSRDKSRDKAKSKEKAKSRDKSKNNSRNKSSEFKKRRNKKCDEGINNTNIKGYFNENTKEHKTFTQLQNNIFLYCTKAKTAIIIVDSFSEDDKDKKYYNNILLKISQTKCPIIILTNNINNIYNISPKKMKSLSINCILCPKNKIDTKLVYLYIFIIYINIKLCSLRFNRKIFSYEILKDYINNIDTETKENELCNENFEKIITLSEYFCYFGKFQLDIIDLRLSEIMIEVEREISNNKLDPKHFGKVLEFIYNNIFINNENFLSNFNGEKNIDEIYEDYEMSSFLDYSDGIKEKIINKAYEYKLKLNDSYENYIKSKDNMVNMEELTLRKYFGYKDIFSRQTNINNNLGRKKYFSFFETVNNKIIDKIKKDEQLIISHYQKKVIQMSLLNNYFYLIKKLISNQKNHKNKITYYIKEDSKESQYFFDMHSLNKLFPKIQGNFFLNKTNIDYATNKILKNIIIQRKINAKLYEK